MTIWFQVIRATVLLHVLAFEVKLGNVRDQLDGTEGGVMPIAPSLYTLHEGRRVREEGIGGGKLLRALCDLGVKALGFWYDRF